ncbi:hypothetical protein VRRI112168_03410 [Vreelandella rituensis]|uniref:Uncharacterized protein n=1 Tax=Vreelandella rituensis TaxID=2282306 RepID=A0A368U9V0_9GAMM|nr:hypothetical protein [Halomonas rituensis]RCV93701.1 hypothetical protein DU506_00680 [Halomonas rituensis]
MKHLSQLTLSALAGCAAGALLTFLAVSTVADTGLHTGDTNSVEPTNSLKTLVQSGLSIKPLDARLDGFQAWQVSNPQSPESTSMLAVTHKGSRGHVLGELFDAQGNPLSTQLLGASAREDIRFMDLAIITQWLPGLSPSAESSASEVYLFIDPLADESRALWEIAAGKSDSLPEIRVIPTAYAHHLGFDAVIDIFTARHDVGASPQDTEDRLHDYLNGTRSVPETVQGNNTPSPVAIHALATNGNIHHRLRLPQEPTVIAPAGMEGKGVDVIPFKEFLETHLGQSPESLTAPKED